MNKKPKAQWQTHLRWLVLSLGTLMLTLALIAIAGLILKDGIAAELTALAGIAIAIPALIVGTLSFVMLIYARIRTVLSKDIE